MLIGIILTSSATEIDSPFTFQSHNRRSNHILGVLKGLLYHVNLDA